MNRRQEQKQIYVRHHRTPVSPAAEFHNFGESFTRLAEASQDLFAAGRQITSELNEITKRIERMSNLTSDTLKSPWLFAGLAIAVGAIMIGISRRHA